MITVEEKLIAMMAILHRIEQGQQKNEASDSNFKME
jgi:hypothetical protein